MCLLLYKPADVEFTKAEISDFYSRNSDGFGVMYSENGEVVTHKIVGSFKQVYKAYQQWAFGRECALHFRMKTHGAIDLDNCHPFKVLDNLWIMHNGILDWPTHVKDMSDTRHFVTDYLTPVLTANPHLIYDDDFWQQVGSLIGGGNKFMVLDNQSNYMIVNEDTGVWLEGVWYSNTYAWSAGRSAGGYLPNYRYYNWQDMYEDAGHNLKTNSLLTEQEALADDEDFEDDEELEDDEQYEGFGHRSIYTPSHYDHYYTNDEHDNYYFSERKRV